MKFTFTLDEEDFLTNLLFTASNSEVIKKRRRKTRFLVPVLYVLFGMFNLKSHLGVAITFFVFGILWMLFYPLREKRRYIKFYKAHIKENFGKRMGNSCSIELENEFLLLTEGDTEIRVPVTDVESITEISTAVIIRLRAGTNLSLPKAKIAHMEELKNILKELAKKLNIVYKEELDWVWK